MLDVTKMTRAKAEKAISTGTDPTLFTAHANYHVRRKAWTKMGRPLPEKLEDQHKLLGTFTGTKPPVSEGPMQLLNYYIKLRRKLGAPPVSAVLAQQPAVA